MVMAVNIPTRLDVHCAGSHSSALWLCQKGQRLERFRVKGQESSGLVYRVQLMWVCSFLQRHQLDSSVRSVMADGEEAPVTNREN